MFLFCFQYTLMTKHCRWKPVGKKTEFSMKSRSLSPCYYTKGALIHPCGRVRSAEGLSPHREISPRSDMAALPQQGAAPLAPLRGYPCTPAKTVHPPLASVPFLRVLLSYPGGDTHSHLPLEHRYCEPRKRQISRCRSRLPKRRKADKRMGRNDP